jgi:methionyl-tRNA formyltransferase
MTVARTTAGSPRAPAVAYFGLPLGALLLARDGVELSLAVLSPVEAPGRRRLFGLLGSRALDARAFETPDALEAAVDRRLETSSPDLIVSWYFTRRLPARWLALPPLGAIGAHPSLLPRHRGPNPFFAAIDQGDAVTGVSVHRLVERYDEGAVLLREQLRVGERNSWQLARALDRPSLALLRQVVQRLSSGEPLVEQAQDESLASWAPEPEGDLLRVDWRWSTERVLRRIRALSPVPGLALEIRGVALFVTEASHTEDFPAALLPGEAAVGPAAVVVRTADGAVAIHRATLADDMSEEAPTLDGAELARVLQGM